MRANEFIQESRGKITKRQQNASVGLNLFFDPSRTDSTYTLNRVMMAVAATDGTFVPEMNDESWIGKDRSAHPYTKEEQQMLRWMNLLTLLSLLLLLLQLWLSSIR